MATTIDTELDNAFVRAQSKSAAVSTLFNDIVNELVYPSLPAEYAITTPPFVELSISQPTDPGNDDINAQLMELKSATDAFAEIYFPEQPETDIAIDTARELLTSYLNGSVSPLESFITTYLQDVLGPPMGSAVDGLVAETGLTLPERFYTDDTPYASRLIDYYGTTRIAYKARLSARLIVEFRKYAANLLLKVDIREEAIRSTSAYVIALGETELAAGDNIVRINQAKASMASATAKWFATQISNDVEDRASLIGEKYQVSKDSIAGTSQYSEIEAKVRAAQAGAGTLMEIAANARNTISAINSAAQVSFG